MKNRKGFTLVEILAVIVIIGILAIIIISALNNSDKNAREKMLQTKRNTSGQQFLLWAQDNIECFLTNSISNDTCIVGVGNHCEDYGNKNEFLKCSTTYEQLAENGLINYDDNSKKIITNPVTNESMNNEEIVIFFNKSNRKFSLSNPHTDIITTKKIFEVPEITLDPDGNSTWSKHHEVDVTIHGGTSGLAPGGTVKYGWSANSNEPSSYTNVSLKYASKDAEVNFKAYNESLTGKYYLWVQPNMTNIDGITITRKVSTETYWFDNTAPADVTMNFVYGSWAAYNGEWTNQNVYAARTQAAKEPSGGADAHSGFKKYQISINNTDWIDYLYDHTNTLYKITIEGDTSRYFRACDKVGNCGAATTVTAHIDKTKPTIASFTGNTKKVTFALKDERSGIASYCLIDQNDSSKCTSWINYSGSTPLNTGNITVDNPHPGKIVYLFAKDKAGNISASKSVDTSCEEIIYKDGTTCTKKCGGGTYNQLAYDKYVQTTRCSAKDKTSGGSACNTMDCCSSVTYKDGDTCSKKCGGGTKNRLAYSAYDGTRCSAKDTSTGGSVCNSMDCCSSVTYKDGTTCTKACGGGTYNRLAYSSYDGSRCSAKDSSSGGSACNTRGCCDSTENYNCGSWSWSACTKSCGSGTKYEYRTCSKRSAYDHTTACSGTATEKRSEGTSCNTQGCCTKTENYNCGNWSWTSCTASCDGGTRYQKRTCSKRSAYDHSTACSGTATEKRYENSTCNTQSCNPCGSNSVYYDSGFNFNCNPVCYYISYSNTWCSNAGSYYICYYCP